MSRARRDQTDIAHCIAVGSDVISRQMQPVGLRHIRCVPNIVAALQTAFDMVVSHTRGVAPGLYLLRHSVPRQRLKGSNRYSVWQRHTTDGLYRPQQPEGLRHIRIVPSVVAALQAASACVTRRNPRALPLGYICSSPSVCFCPCHTTKPQGVAAGLHLFQPVGLAFTAMNQKIKQ